MSKHCKPIRANAMSGVILIISLILVLVAGLIIGYETKGLVVA